MAVSVALDHSRGLSARRLSVKLGCSGCWIGSRGGYRDCERHLHRRCANRGVARVRWLVAQVVHHGTDHRSQICTAFTAPGLEPPSISVWDFGLDAARILEVLPSS